MTIGEAIAAVATPLITIGFGGWIALMRHRAKARDEREKAMLEQLADQRAQIARLNLDLRAEAEKRHTEAMVVRDLAISLASVVEHNTEALRASKIAHDMEDADG